MSSVVDSFDKNTFKYLNSQNKYFSEKDLESPLTSDVTLLTIHSLSNKYHKRGMVANKIKLICINIFGNFTKYINSGNTIPAPCNNSIKKENTFLIIYKS